MKPILLLAESCEEYHELAAAAKQIRADVAARRARGWPKRLLCLGCDRPRIATSPSDRLCDPCRDRAADLDRKFVDDVVARPPSTSY